MVGWTRFRLVLCVCVCLCVCTHKSYPSHFNPRLHRLFQAVLFWIVLNMHAHTPPLAAELSPNKLTWFLYQSSMEIFIGELRLARGPGQSQPPSNYPAYSSCLLPSRNDRAWISINYIVVWSYNSSCYLLAQAANPMIKPTATYHMQKEKCES